MPQRYPFPVDPILTAIAIAYVNKSLIADLLMPRIPPLARSEFKYTRFDLAEGFTVPNTQVGRKSRTPEISFSGEEVTESTADYGLEDAIPQSDINNADARFSPVNRSTEQLTNLIELDREVRVSNIVNDPDNYADDNQQKIEAGKGFNNPNTDILGMIEAAKNKVVMTPNTLTLGQSVWSAMRMHPQIVKAVHGNSGDSGMASQAQVAELLEFDQLLVGRANINTAKKGQAVKLERTWGDMLAMHYQDAMADNRNGTTWGFTAQFGQRVSGQWEDKNIGLRGGQRVRVGESVKEVVAAKDLGYLMIDVLA